MVYPAIAAPTAFGVDSVSVNCGTAFGHQGRLVVIVPLTNFTGGTYGWPVTPTIAPNEAFCYTDPPQTETGVSQGETFGPENPFGYGAISSVSAGELFCVKRRGGAVIIQGDLNNPTVTSLPGVRSTGVFYGRSDTDQNGMYYCALKQGAWLWSGGNASQKISNQLDDNFFVPTPVITDSDYYGFYCQRWSDWMLFSNNWIYNTTSGGWWRLANPAAMTPGSIFWYVPGYDPRFMFVAHQAVGSSSDKFLWEYDRQTPNGSFTWQSLPIKFPQEDRTSTNREIVLRASNPYADAAPQIICSLVDDKGNVSVLDTWHMTTGIDTVQETRLNSAIKQTTTVAIRITASGTTYAPVLHGISVGYRSREHVGIT
jgi:hypothetical protein